jgi:peptide/nickel transport system ATP-binding protein
MRIEQPELVVRDLSVHAGAAEGARALVDRISLTVGKERVALVGESGSGKSLTARAIMGLLRAPLVASASELRFGCTDLRTLGPRGWNALRGRHLALVLQDPRRALNAVLTVGRQLDEMVRLHGRFPYAQRRERIAAMLRAVGLTTDVLAAYPAALSGGMGQRVVLAMMLVNDPELLIADEPTSALDEALRDQVLELMCELVSARGMGLLLISHDLQQVARYCDRALVMFRGRIVDECPAVALAHSTHPYTRTLWSCRPSGRTYGSDLPVLDREWQAGEAVR